MFKFLVTWCTATQPRRDVTCARIDIWNLAFISNVPIDVTCSTGTKKKMSSSNTAPNGASSGDSRDPSAFLSEIIGAPVTVKLNSGVVYKGECDSHVDLQE